MEPFYNYLNKLVGISRNQFDEFPQIKWLNSSIALKAQMKKDKLSAGLSWMHKSTKPYYHHISPGCKLCGEGTWSCLFITNKCNAHCFYCPASQEKDEIPSTQSLTFNSPKNYAEYINYFGFKGISFSGGEPLLFFDRTLQYLRTIREKCHPDIYIWMYTNGILATPEKFR